MSELWTPEGEFYQQPPSAMDLVVPTSAEFEIYKSFARRIQSFGGFRQRDYADARNDFVATMLEAAMPNAEEDRLKLLPLEARRGIIQQVITPASYDAYKADMLDFWQTYQIEKRLAERSIVIFTNHRAFSDIPVSAVVVSDMRSADPFAVQRNVQVVGRMIPGMEVDMYGTGDYLIVSDLLRQAGRQVQTVPGVKDLSENALKLREVWNDESKEALQHLLNEPGNIIFIAASGTHDQVEGSELVMQHVNRETMKLLYESGVDIIPLFFSCMSFSPDGLVAVDAQYRLLPPRQFSSHEDGLQTMLEMAAAGSEVLADEFSTVTYAESFADRSGRVTREVGRKVVQKVSELRRRYDNPQQD